MKVFKKNTAAVLPEYATAGSAAFDLSACLEGTSRVRAYNPHNREMFFPVKALNGREGLQIMPGFRVLVPTGLAFDIPEDHVLDVNIRSGVALKLGLTLANGTGIIDSDYIEEVGVMLFNTGDTPVYIYHGERIAQGKLVKVVRAQLEETTEELTPKSERAGGFGSTGVAALTTAAAVIAEITESATTEEAPKKKGRGGRPRKNPVA